MGITAVDGIDVALELSGEDRMGTALTRRVTDVCDRIEAAEDDVLLVRLSGAESEPALPSGIDIHAVNKWERALRRLERSPVVTLAVVDGVCQGPAAEALLATDHRVAHPAARFRFAAGPDVWPGMALYRLAGQLGHRARRVALLGTELSAAQALRWGLIDEIDDDPESAAARKAKLLRGARASGVALRRQLLAEAATTPFEEALGSHLAASDRALRGAER
ncbi:enoyl-CoA-hydratase DpgB [Streptomyces javensis]|uniref:enoyl-CoA-hydratase DpgB n=1 Tax=Streptomyces javensis TaxID=114698 RepID=UPI0033D1FF72